MTLARRASLLAPAWALAMPLAAQQPDTVPRDTATLAPIVVTGARLPTARAAAPGLTGRTAVLQAADLDARGVRTLADALEQLPGVTTADELGAPGQMDVTLRGFQVSPTIGLPQGVTVYLDGVRVNEPDAHEVNFDLLPLGAARPQRARRRREPGHAPRRRARRARDRGLGRQLRALRAQGPRRRPRRDLGLLRGRPLRARGRLARAHAQPQRHAVRQGGAEQRHLG